MRFTKTLVVAVAALALVSIKSASPGEEKLPLDKVPKQVTDAVAKRFPDAKVTEAAKETEDGKTFYELTFKEKGKNVDVSVTPDGALTMIEKEIPVKELPEKVTKGLERKHPKGTHKFAEVVYKVKDGEEKLSYYEVVVAAADKKTWEVEIDAEGEIKKEEDKTKEVEKEKEGDKKDKEKDKNDKDG